MRGGDARVDCRWPSHCPRIVGGPRIESSGVLTGANADANKQKLSGGQISRKERREAALSGKTLFPTLVVLAADGAGLVVFFLKRLFSCLLFLCIGNRILHLRGIADVDLFVS